MQKYRLMHRNTICGNILFDEQNGNILSYSDMGSGESPFLGNADERRIKSWWKTRAVPASRSIIQKLLNGPDGITAEQYLEKNLALSITDSYWICPCDLDIEYEKVRFGNLSTFNEGKIPYHNVTSYDPNASLGGQMEKYWDLSGNTPVLVKECYKYFGQQAVNEVFASRIHEFLGTGTAYTAYTASKTEDNGMVCRCDAFTSDRVELIPAYEVVESQKCGNDTSVYDHLVNVAESNGIDREVMQGFLDYQTATDFIISNDDEHLMNFGVLRDAVTMKLLGPAPIFDSGNSMFYSEGIRCRHTRASLLERKITGVHKTEDKMLMLIENRNIIDIERLPDKEYVINFYTKAGIPEEKAECIADNYGLKTDMFREFQRGGKISAFIEKSKK